MRHLPYSTSFIIYLVFISLDLYVYQTIKTLTKNKIIRVGYWFLNAIILITISVIYLFYSKESVFAVKLLLALIILSYIPKLFLVFFLLLEDIVRIFSFIFRKIKNKENKSEEKFYPERRKAVSLMALGFASIPLFGGIHGIAWGRHKFTIKKISLYFEDLPYEFDKYKIVQISDIHLGSFGKSEIEKVVHGLKLINDQDADLILFTGDSVNFIAEEMKPWIPLFSKINAKDGKFSTLGNHDYGLYRYGNNEETIQKSRDLLDKYHYEAGFKLLNNDMIKISKNNSSINIIGVENWGLPPFPQYGDLEKATEKLGDNEFNILMSHDPTYFDVTVKNFDKKMHLTLSGHTHGMQCGVDIPGIIKWSPAKYKYPKWSGLYEENNLYLYVNRGFGYIGFPGRVGMWPEITVIELNKKNVI